MIESLITGAVGAGVITVFGNIIMFVLQRRANKEDKESLNLEGRLTQQEEEQKLLKAAVEAQLHDRIYQGCRYHIGKGSVSVAELTNMEHLYKAYHNLGGNGTGTELYKRICDLPIDEESI